MKIEELTLTDEEMNEAVQGYLNWHNIKVKVLTIEGKGYPRHAWSISVEGEGKTLASLVPKAQPQSQAQVEVE